MENKNWLSTKEAAKYLNLSESTLRQSRMSGIGDWNKNRIKGPSYFKLGRRVLYLLEDLDKWIKECRVKVTR